MTSNSKKMAYAASRIANDRETQQSSASSPSPSCPPIRQRAAPVGRDWCTREFVMTWESLSHMEARPKRGLRLGRIVPGGGRWCYWARCSQHRQSS